VGGTLNRGPARIRTSPGAHRTLSHDLGANPWADFYARGLTGGHIACYKTIRCHGLLAVSAFWAESASFGVFANFSKINSSYAEFSGVFGEKRGRVSY
jgi:hypothetical protein